MNRYFSFNNLSKIITNVERYTADCTLKVIIIYHWINQRNQPLGTAATTSVGSKQHQCIDFNTICLAKGNFQCIRFGLLVSWMVGCFLLGKSLSLTFRKLFTF